MGSAPSKNDKFEFDKKHYIEIIQEAMKTDTTNSNEDALKNYGCLMGGHFERPIEFICSNIICNAQFRMVCKICTQQELHIGDKEKLFHSLKQDHEINDIIEQFKILINKVIDSMEFDIIVEQLECYNHQNQQIIMPQIHNLEKLKQDLLKFKLYIKNLDNKDYYEKLRISKRLGLLEYFKEHSTYLQRLETILIQKNYKSQQNALDLQLIDQEGKKLKNQPQFLLLDLFRSRQFIFIDQHYQHKYKDKKFQNVLNREVDNIFKQVNKLIKNKNYDVFYQMQLFLYHLRRDQVFFKYNLSATQYKVILEMQITIHINENEKNMAFDLISSILNLLPLKVSFPILSKSKWYLDQSFVGKWNLEEANYIIDYIIQSVSKEYYQFLQILGHHKDLNLKKSCVNIEDLQKLIPFFQFCLIQGILQNTVGYIPENQNKIDEALMAFDYAIKLNPNDAQRYYIKAEFLEKSQKIDEAIMVFDQLIQLNPKPTFFLISYHSIQILDSITLNEWSTQEMIEQGSMIRCLDPQDEYNYQKRAKLLKKSQRTQLHNK